MAETLRTCCRTGCNRPAAASLSFRYETRQVWVTVPDASGTGHRYNLCGDHAANLIVPRGWHRVEERAARSSRRARTAEPAASQAPGAPQAPKRPPRKRRTPAPAESEPAQVPAAAVAAHRADRYARLLSELPGVAEQAPSRPPRTESPLLGQLAIPVPEPVGAGAVIVPFTELASARRSGVTSPSGG